MSDVKYFNFPIQLLEDLFKNKVKTLTNILYYALYVHSLKLELEEDEVYKFVSAAKYYGVTLGSKDYDDIKRDFQTGQKIHNKLPSNSPKAGINITIFWDFYKNDKSDFDLACLAAFLAIKSILGPAKPYWKIENKYLWARMDGKAKKIENISELSAAIAKFAKEYQTKKIKNALADGWGLKTYSRYNRGFYVSFDLDKEALITEAELKRKSYLDKKRRADEKELVKKVLNKLEQGQKQRQ